MSSRVSLKGAQLKVAGKEVTTFEDGFIDYGDDHPLDDDSLSPFEHMVEILARPVVVTLEGTLTRRNAISPNGMPVIDVDGESED